MLLVVDPAKSERVEGDSHLLFHQASWRFYENILREYDGVPQRINYANGVLELITLSYLHEQYSRFLHDVITLISLDRGIAVSPAGSTTLKRERELKGLEPDESYYIAREKELIGKSQIDLRDDPPPDLVIEIDVTHHVVDREAIYAAFKVPEMWVCGHGGIVAYQLRDGAWTATERSLSFPFLRPAELSPFIKRLTSESPTTVLLSVRDWLKHLS